MFADVSATTAAFCRTMSACQV